MSSTLAGYNTGDTIVRKYFIAAAFVVVAASPALSATQGQHLRKAVTAEGSYAYAAPSTDIVVIDGKVVGRDPDVFIRGQLLRAGDPAEQNGGN